MTPGKVFVFALVANIALAAACGVAVVKLGRMAWRSYEADRDARCRLALTVQPTRRDSVTYVVEHNCQAVLAVKP